MPYKDPVKEKESRQRRYYANWEHERAVRKKWHADNKEKALANSYKYRSKHPEKWKSYQRKYRETHKEEKAKKDAIYWANHRELANAHAQKSRTEHPDRWAAYKANRRARELASGDKLTEQDILALKEKYGNVCLMCRESKETIEARRDKLTFDHVIPLAHNGKNSVENGQPLCGRCNSRKSTLTHDYRA